MWTSSVCTFTLFFLLHVTKSIALKEQLTSWHSKEKIMSSAPDRKKDLQFLIYYILLYLITPAVRSQILVQQHTAHTRPRSVAEVERNRWACTLPWQANSTTSRSNSPNIDSTSFSQVGFDHSVLHSRSLSIQHEMVCLTPYFCKIDKFSAMNNSHLSGFFLLPWAVYPHTMEKYTANVLHIVIKTSIK